MKAYFKLSELLKSWLVFSALFVVFLASSYALFHPSFFHVHDFTHAARIAEMTRALDAGQFPVRWSENFGYGFGMPLFNFYAPLPYFFGALFYKMGFSLVGSIKVLYLLVNLLSLFGAYLLGRTLTGRAGGLILAAAYTLAPYRALNLFVRGALSEAVAMAFMPFVLWAILAFSQGQNRKYLLVLVLALTGIILSHNLTALIFIPLAALFSFLYLWKIKQLRLLWSLAGHFLLAAALSAFYMLPAYLEKDATIISRIFGGYFHYSHHFLYLRQFFQDNWAYGGSGWGPNDDISFYLGIGQIVGLLSAGLLLAINLRQKWNLIFKSKSFFLFTIFAAMLVASLLMSTLKTVWLWDHLTLLQYIQFPWRFLSAAALLLAILLAFNFFWLQGLAKRTALAAFLLLLILFNARYFKPERYLDNVEALYYGDPQRIQAEMSEILPDYIPKQMAAEDLLKDQGPTAPLAWLEPGYPAMNKNDKLETALDRGFEKMFVISFAEPRLINFKVAYFPGWLAEIDGQSQEIRVNEKLGNIQVMVPEGERKVTLRFGETTPARVYGSSISLLALLYLAYSFAPFAKTKR